MNLYDFSQVNNNEMGVYIDREAEPDLYRDVHDEAQRLIRISDQVRLSAETVSDDEEQGEEEYEKLTTSKIAKAIGMKTADLTDRLVEKGLLLKDGDQLKLTDAGKEAGGEFRLSKRYGPYFLWPKDMTV